jgi:hypothetical protein
MGEQLEIKILGKKLEMDTMGNLIINNHLLLEWNNLISFNKSHMAKCDYQQSFIIGVVRYISQ